MPGTLVHLEGSPAEIGFQHGALLAAEQAFRVLLVHHPLHSTSRVKRLTDSRQLRALIRQHGVELVLHGHDHARAQLKSWLNRKRGNRRNEQALRAAES